MARSLQDFAGPAGSQQAKLARRGTLPRRWRFDFGSQKSNGSQNSECSQAISCQRSAFIQASSCRLGDSRNSAFSQGVRSLSTRFRCCQPRDCAWQRRLRKVYARIRSPHQVVQLVAVVVVVESFLSLDVGGISPGKPASPLGTLYIAALQFALRLELCITRWKLGLRVETCITALETYMTAYARITSRRTIFMIAYAVGWPRLQALHRGRIFHGRLCKYYASLYGHLCNGMAAYASSTSV